MRPTGVTILAVLYFLATALYVIAGLLLMLGMGMLGAAAGQSGAEGAGGMMAILMGLGALAGVVLLVFAVIALAIGLGLWKLKNWARIVALVLCALGALGALVGLATGAMAGEMVSVGFNVIFLALYGWIIWYLLQPHVKQAFGAA